MRALLIVVCAAALLAPGCKGDSDDTTTPSPATAPETEPDEEAAPETEPDEEAAPDTEPDEEAAPDTEPDEEAATDTEPDEEAAPDEEAEPEGEAEPEVDEACVKECVERNMMRSVGPEVIEADCREECAGA